MLFKDILMTVATQAGGGAAWSPLSLGSKLKGWWDPSDASSMTISSGVSQINDKSGNANHLSQGTAGMRPQNNSGSGLFWINFDGGDELVKTSGVTGLGTNMELYAVLRPNSGESSWVTLEDGLHASNFIGTAEASSGSSASAGAGTPSYLVDGGAIGSTRGDLATALPASNIHLLEVQAADLSGWGSRLGLCGYATGGYPYDGRLYQLVLTTSLTAGERALLRTFCGAKGGLTL